MLGPTTSPAAGPYGRRPGLGGAAAPRDKTLVSVVWCRQVDNEAESPGYTTVPSDFPGRAETLEMVRIVGNLAVNASDTHDYWDPDPASKLAYYHNLFLYPANGGNYLCLGRMFLSTEDRPRLGMKTLVLDASLLLSQPNAGEAVRRWYGSMGNPGRPAQQEGKADPALLDVLSDAFTFYRSDPTKPLLGFVSDNFHDAVESVLTLLERAPAVMTSLSGILIFPYFLPVPRVNLNEFTETFPLNLALFRIPRNEAGGERHARRATSWSGQPVQLMDLTAGVPVELAGRPAAPLPVAWWKVGDHDAECADLRRAVDRVELARYQEAAKGLEKAGGTARRKTLGRVAAAASAVAQTLALAPSDRLRLDASISSLARPYLEASPSGAAVAPSAAATPLPLGTRPAPPPSGPIAEPPAPLAVEVPRSPASASEGADPPWRRPTRLRVDRTEVVSVPRVAPEGAAPGAEPPSAGVAPAAAPSLSVPAAAPPEALGSTSYNAALLAELQRYVDQRIAQGAAPGRNELEPDVVGRLERELSRKLEARAALLVSPQALDARIAEAMSRRPPPDPKAMMTEEFRSSLAEVVDALVASKVAEVTAAAARTPKAPAELPVGKINDHLVDLLSGKASDSRVVQVVDQRVQQAVSSSVEAERNALNDQLEAILKEAQRGNVAQKELEGALRSEVRFLDEKLRTLMGQLIPLLRKTWLKIDELEKKGGGDVASDQKLKKLRDEMWREMKRLEVDLSERTKMILDRVEGNVQNQGRLWLTLVGQLSSLTEQRRELSRIVADSKEDFEPSAPAPASPNAADEPPVELDAPLDPAMEPPPTTPSSKSRR